MADDYGDRPVSRATLMEIQADREIIEEGYSFLDEKLVMLAQELLRRLRGYEQARADLRQREAAAHRALAEAVGRHGLEGLEAYPPQPLAEARLTWRPREYLGVRLMVAPELAIRYREEAGGQPPRPSAEARECAERFRQLTEAAAGLAAEAANLHRLLAEYRRTEQRARALDNVVLPEVREAETRMGERLAESEQEEAVRIRLFAPDRRIG
jgi:V/A-type H+-transporting ATPase subunit D